MVVLPLVPVMLSWLKLVIHCVDTLTGLVVVFGGVGVGVVGVGVGLLAAPGVRDRPRMLYCVASAEAIRIVLTPALR